MTERNNRNQFKLEDLKDQDEGKACNLQNFCEL